MSKITAIVNQKGGVGKTTTALNLSYALSEKGNKVLLIDFDPQASLTLALGYDGNDTINIQTLMAKEIEEEDFDEHYSIKVRDRLELIPASIDLAKLEASLVDVISRETILRDLIGRIEASYDYILIDCSPSLGFLTVNALTASDSLIIPVTPEYLSARGLQLLIESIRKAKRKLNKNLTIDGILLTMVNDRTNLAKKMSEIINNSVQFIETKTGIKTKVFNANIPISVKTGEAIANEQSIIEYDPRNKVAIKYKEFAKEWEGK